MKRPGMIILLTAVSCAGSTAELLFVRGTNVRLRAEPNTNSTIVATVQGGTSVKSIGTTGVTETIGPWSGVWHEVTVTSGPSTNSSGWIFGAFLVTPEEGPATLLESADSADSPGEAVRRYERLQTEFPAYNEHGLFETDVWVANRIAVNKCWEHKLGQPDLDERAVIEQSAVAIQNQDAEALLALASCDFILMEGGCAGGSARRTDVTRSSGTRDCSGNGSRLVAPGRWLLRYWRLPRILFTFLGSLRTPLPEFCVHPGTTKSVSPHCLRRLFVNGTPLRELQRVKRKPRTRMAGASVAPTLRP